MDAAAKEVGVSEPIKIDAAAIERLACPRCKSSLRHDGASFTCVSAECARAYPIVGGVPVLVDEENSVFSLAEFVTAAPTTFDWEHARQRRQSNFLKRAAHLVADHAPPFSLLVSELRPEQALQEICAAIPGARILVIGCGDALYQAPPPATILYSDVSIGPITEMVFDANSIPFADESFDGVITVAVLCYAADPFRCAAEIRRVLKPDGFVYDTLPFMQQVTMGKYDFTRFTFLGHRRLFRGFKELRHGISNGPGMALAWSLSYFLASFTQNLSLRKAIRLASRYLFFWVKYFDRFLARKEGAYDCASGFYFFGRKAGRELTDREILEMHRGLNPR